MKESLEKNDLREDRKSLITKLLAESQLTYATAKAIIVFIVIRLLLGVFGMDLYEIYWWFSLGISISLYYIHKIVLKKAVNLDITFSK